VVLAIRSRIPWYPWKTRPANAFVALVDETPYREQMIYQNMQADLLVEGDVATTLSALTKIARDANLPHEVIAARRARHAASHEERLRKQRAAVDAVRGIGPIDPVWLVAALGEALPDDAIYVDETVTHRRAIDAHLQNKGPGSFFKVRGALGQCLGHAIGVKLANRERPVVALVGDGALLYGPVTQSIGYAAEAGLPILIVVFNNSEYRAMRVNHLDYYPDGVGKQHGIYYGSPLQGPDYALLGAPFGAFGRKVEDPAELVPAIRAALAATKEGRPAILNVVLER
jgi:acetolactate synthase-1/2/3 large subunit